MTICYKIATVHGVVDSTELYVCAVDAVIIL